MNPEFSFDDLATLANEGDPVAQCALGEFYHHKNGVGSMALAASWFLKAAIQDYAPAQLALALLYLAELAPEEYERGARYWLQRAAQNGCRKGARLLNEANPKDECIDASDLLVEADAGNPNAQFEIGYALLFGLGLRQRVNEGLSWIFKGAVAGNDRAQAYIGSHYLFAGCPEEANSEAFKWLWLAAQQNEPSALYYLGFCFHEGIGIGRNDHRAACYLLQAARLGHSDAQFHLARFYHEGIGLTANHEQAQGWCQAAALQDHEEARIMLEQLYFN